MNTRGHREEDAGTTLVELMVYVALLAISASALYSILISNMKTYDSIENRMVMHQDLRNAISLMGREIRMSGLDPKGAGGVGFQQGPDDNFDTDANSIHFTLDLNNDGDTSDQGEDIGYFLQYDPSTSRYNLMRRADYGHGLAGEVLLEGVTSFQLSYFDQDNTTPIAAPSGNDTYFVNLLVEAETSKEDVVSGGTKKQTLEDRVRVRNAGM